MIKWRCRICGYIHAGASPPDICPVCGGTADDFKIMEDFFPQTSKKEIQRIIVIGNGAAGMEAARTIRSQNDTVEILVLTEESFPFYSRIHLSTFIGDESRVEDITIFPEPWYAEQNILVKLGKKISTISPRRKLVTDQTGQEYQYEKLIIATGASPFLPDIPGVNKNGVLVLRNLKDALKIRETVRTHQRAVVIGGGILGIEAASSLNRLGIDTTIVELADHLMPLQLNIRAAEVLQKILQDRGLTIICKTRVTELTGNSKLRGINLHTGKSLSTDLALFSTGIIPNIKLAKEAGIKTGRGIWVNEKMETTVPHIYAAGDVAECNDTLHGIWPAAVDQGIIAGTNALGFSQNYSGNMPLHILKVAGLEMTAVGQKSKMHPNDQVIEYLNHEYAQYVTLIHNSHILKGAIVLGVPGIGFRLEKLIKKQVPIAPIISELERANWDILKKYRP